eukprot:g14877.t1
MTSPAVFERLAAKLRPFSASACDALPAPKLWSPNGASDSVENVEEALRPVVQRSEGGGPILVDGDREWFELLHGKGPSTKGSDFLSPFALWNFLGKHVFQIPDGVEPKIGGDVRWLGGLLVLDGEGREVFRHTESRYGDICDVDALQAAVDRLAT